MSAISSLCRTCMANVVNATEEDVYSYNIFETDGLAEKLMLCSNIEIEPYDEYPPHVCNTCCINILDFCDFQEMCRESLEKFNKMLEKQTKTGDDVGVVVSKDRLTNTIVIKAESDHEMILGDNSINKLQDTEGDIIEIRNDPDSDEETDNDPLTGTKDCVIVEAITIARRETMEKIINCEHDYSHSGDFAVSRPLVGGSEQGDDVGEVADYEDGTGLGYNNMLKVISPVDQTLYLNSISTELNLNMLEVVSPDGDVKSKDGSSKSENEFVSIEGDINEDIDLFEDLPVIEESFSVTASDTSAKPIARTLPCNNTDKDKGQLFEYYSDDCEINKPQLEIVDFENEEERKYFMKLSEDQEAKNTQLENGDCENEEECIFEDLSDAEEGDKKRLKRVSEDEVNEANEEYLYASPTEDEEIYSDSDTVLSDSKPKTVKYPKFSCDLCPQNFILEQRLIAHKRRHQGLAGYPCSRENCTRSYNRLVDLRQHLRDHDGIPRHIYKCPINNCGLKYITKKGLDLHLRKHHNRGPAIPARKYVCETCGKVYQHAHALRIHQYIHVDASLWPFKCDIGGCSKKFRSSGNFKIHKNRHYGIKPYACTFCDKRFCTSTNLQAHLNFHTLEKKWVCSICPRVCYTPANLRVHIRKKHQNHPDGKNFPCRFCNKILSTFTVRKYHERRHTGERPFVCEECGRGFIQASSLKIHKQTHLPDGETVNKFQCRVCNQAMTTAINLKYHEMIHTGEKPFECDKCGVKFRYQSNLARHQKKTPCRNPISIKDKHGTEKSQTDEIVENDVKDAQ